MYLSKIRGEVVKVDKSLNYIKQNRLKDNLHWRRGFSMETLCTHEYGILLARVDLGPHVLIFLLGAFVFELWS